MACRIVTALGGSMGQSFAIIGCFFPDRIASISAVIQVFNGLGLMIGPLLGGLLYQFGGFQLPFFVMGGALFLGILRFNWVSGVPSTVSSVGCSNVVYTSVGSGWYRISFSATTSSTSNRIYLYPEQTGLASGTVNAWGAQLTQGSTIQTYLDNGQWQTLSYTTPTMPYDSVLDFYVDCDGTTGWVNVDEWKSNGADSRNNNYWLQNGPHIEADWKKPGGTYTFIS